MKKVSLIIAAAMILVGCRKDSIPDTGKENPFRPGTLTEAGLDEDRILDLENQINAGKYNIHSLLILRHNKLVYEHYFPGEDAVFPIPVGRVEHHMDSLHDCRSVTKSIVSTCIGIAISQGKIKSLDEKVFQYFPEYAKYAVGAKAEITIRELLTMTSGLEWNESLPYVDEANSERQMSVQPDVVDFILSRNSLAKPGSLWNYNGGCTQLLAQIILKTTGLPVNEYAKKYLFTPLGIRNYHWYVREDGIIWAASGLRLTSRDMLKIGWMYVHDGNWNGTSIISSEWARLATKWHVDTDDASDGYGYQFWCAKPLIAGEHRDMAMADGNGGQRICMIPSLDLAVVITAGNYDEDGDISDDVLREYIFSAVKK